MYSRNDWIFLASMLVILTLLIKRSSGNSSQFTKYEVFAGRTFSSDAEFTTVSNSKTECLMSLRALTNDVMYTIAVYNESSKSCTKSSIGNQSLIIQESVNTDSVALWNSNVCSVFTSPESAVFEYIDTDMYGFDMTTQLVSSVVECVNLCETNHGNAFKGFVYQYASSKKCHCKSVSVKEFQELGHSLTYLSGYSYYARLCFN